MPASTSSVLKDIGAYFTAVFSHINVTGTAGGAGDATESDGAWHAVPDDAQSVAVVVTFTTTLDPTETMTLALNLQDATDVSGTGAADFQTSNSVAATLVATGGAGGSTETGVLKARFQDLRAHRGFIRAQITGNLSRASLDTFEYAAVLVYGGTRSVPALA